MPRATWMFWGQLLQIVGACYLAVNEPSSWMAYYMMLVGAVILLCVARESKAVWATFLVINLIGVWRWTPWGLL